MNSGAYPANTSLKPRPVAAYLRQSNLIFFEYLFNGFANELVHRFQGDFWFVWFFRSAVFRIEIGYLFLVCFLAQA